MRDLLIAVVAAFSMTQGVVAHEGLPEVDDEVWAYACAYVEVFEDVQCGDLDKPKILYNEFRSYFGTPQTTLYGRHYLGSEYIEINVRFYGTEMARTTAVHETVHYIGAHQDAGWSKCYSEDVARRVHHLWEGTEYDPEWKVRYKCA